MFGDQLASDVQTCLRRRRTNQVHNGGVGIQRLACPTFADFAEQAMLDRIPLGSAGRKMAHGDLLSQR